MSSSDDLPESATFREFRRAFFGELHRDGPDMRVLDALLPTERRVAERQLLDRLGDPRGDLDAIKGLAHLRSQKAVEPLRKIMQNRRDPRVVFAAIALWRIEEDEQALEVLSRVVERRPWIGRDSARAHAAAVLRHIDRLAALVPLIDALDDRDVAVRSNAMLAIAERLRLNAEADALDSGHMSLAEFQARARTALARRQGESS